MRSGASKSAQGPPTSSSPAVPSRSMIHCPVGPRSCGAVRLWAASSEPKFVGGSDSFRDPQPKGVTSCSEPANRVPHLGGPFSPSLGRASSSSPLVACAIPGSDSEAVLLSSGGRSLGADVTFVAKSAGVNPKTEIPRVVDRFETISPGDVKLVTVLSTAGTLVDSSAQTASSPNAVSAEVRR